MRKAIRLLRLGRIRIRKFQISLDNYVYTGEDTILEGEIKLGKQYDETNFNRDIEIIAREKHRVQLFMDEANPNDKTYFLCNTATGRFNSGFSESVSTIQKKL